MLAHIEFGHAGRDTLLLTPVLHSLTHERLLRFARGQFLVQFCSDDHSAACKERPVTFIALNALGLDPPDLRLSLHVYLDGPSDANQENRACNLCSHHSDIVQHIHSSFLR